MKICRQYIFFKVKFIKSSSWQGILLEFAEKFVQHQRDLTLLLSVTIHHATSRIELAIIQIHDILRQKSTAEDEVHHLLDAQGGIENCLANDELFAQLVKKSGVVIPAKETQPAYSVSMAQPYQVMTTQPPYGFSKVQQSYPKRTSQPGPPYGFTTRHQQQNYAPTLVLPYSSHFVYETRNQYPLSYPYGPPVVVENSSSRSRSPPKRHYRHHFRKRGDRDRSPSSSSSERGGRRPRKSVSPSTHVSQDDFSYSDSILQLKIQVTAALKNTFDAVIQENMTQWMIKFNYAIQSSIESSIAKIFEAIGPGQHERLHNPQMRKIWELEARFTLVFYVLLTHSLAEMEELCDRPNSSGRNS